MTRKDKKFLRKLWIGIWNKRIFTACCHKAEDVIKQNEEIKAMMAIRDRLDYL